MAAAVGVACSMLSSNIERKKEEGENDDKIGQ